MDSPHSSLQLYREQCCLPVLSSPAPLQQHTKMSRATSSTLQAPISPVTECTSWERSTGAGWSWVCTAISLWRFLPRRALPCIYRRTQKDMLMPHRRLSSAMCISCGKTAQLYGAVEDFKSWKSGPSHGSAGGSHRSHDGGPGSYRLAGMPTPPGPGG